VQVALKQGASAVVGVDLLPVDPIPGAVLIQADFTDPGVDQQLIDALGGPPDLVLSDMAHNTVGHRQTDHLKIIALIEAAAEFAIRTLKPGGSFVTKNFQGGDAGGLLETLRAEFREVKFIKPQASRKGSSEVYLAALGRK
jgi:23S rRNA (uridine2552-2'-O)-methyltransferase